MPRRQSSRPAVAPRRRRPQEFNASAVGGVWQAGSPLPQLQVLVAFNNGANDDPTTITQVAFPQGTLGGVNVWTDVSQHVSNVGYTRGRQHELDRFEAGHLTLELKNYEDGRFNPWNTASPYAGLLVPMKPVQIRLVAGGLTYFRYTGHVTGWPVKWPDNFTAFTDIEAYDAFRLFNNSDMIRQTQYAATVLTDSPLVFWRLSDGAGSTVATDTSGNNHPGALTGQTTFGAVGPLPADPATAAAFNATGAFTSASGLLSGAQASSLEAWFNIPSTSNPATLPDIVSYGNTTNGWNDLFMNGDGTIHFQLEGGGTLLSPLAYNDGRWHHAVGVMPANGVGCVLYVDGASVATGNAGFPAAYQANDYFTVGGFDSAGTLKLTGLGLVANAALYSSVLPAARVLAHYQAGTANLVQQGSGAQIGASLDIVGWSSTARNLDTGSSTVQAPSNNLSATGVLSFMQVIEQTDDGCLFMAGNGTVRFIARQSLSTNSLYSSVQATFGDNPGEIPFDPGPDLGIDDLDIWNEAVVTRSGGIAQRTADATSITTYGRRTQSLSGLLHTTDAESLSHAQWITSLFAQPVVRLRSIVIDMLSLTSTPNLVAQVLSLDLMYRVTVNRHGAPGGGTTFTQTGLVEGIEEHMNPDAWTVTLHLSPIDAIPMFTLDSATAGLLDTSRLGW